MNVSELKSRIHKNSPFYVFGITLIFILKFFYSRAGIAVLEWILAPTARWVSLLSGVGFEKDLQLGYVNHSHQFIIGAPCSGLQFMIIAFATLLFSFVHRMDTSAKKTGWAACSIVCAYLITIFVNGFRITLSLALSTQPPVGGWFTPERLHTIEGVAVYFTSLLVLHCAASAVFKKILNDSPLSVQMSQAGQKKVPVFLSPVFWYFAIILGIPLLNRAYQDSPEAFIEYGLIIAAVCFVVLCFFHVPSFFKKQAHRHKKSG